MTLLDILCGPVCQRLAWTLLHFVWQGFLVAAGVVVIGWLFRAAQARSRYAVAVAGLLLMACCPLITFAVLEGSAPSRAEPALPALDPVGVGSLKAPTAEPPFSDSPPPRLARSKAVAVAPPSAVVTEPSGPPEEVGWRTVMYRLAAALQPYAVLAWLAGVFALSTRLLASLLDVRRLSRRRLPISAELAACAARLAERLGLSGPPRVFLSERVREAILVGLWRPMILLPVVWVTEMTPDVLEAVIAHELAHVRRWDLWTNLLQRLVETLLFYHPAVWWLSRRASLQREMCADELAVAATGERVTYAGVLELLGRRRLNLPAPQLAATMGGRKMALFDRIRNVLGVVPGEDRLRWWPAGLLALLVPLGIWLGAACVGSAELEGAVPAETGVTVQGTVVDAKTGKPVQGARVAPMVFRSPLFSPDWDRKVETDADGKFTLQEVDGSVRIQVAHPDYYDFECDFWNEKESGKRPGEKLYVVRVALKSGEKLTGVVKDPAGKPLAAVEVEDLAGKKTVTGNDGRFALKSIRLNGDGKYYLVVTAKGYIRQTLQPEKIPAEEVSIVLEPLLRIPGRVLSPDGRPVRQFTVAAGPGRNPPESNCERAEVDDPQGRWELRTEQRGTHWVGVRAEGFAPWEAWTEVGKQNEPFTVRLQSGVSVTGKVRGTRGNVHEARIVLTPQRADGDEIIVDGTPARDMGVIRGVSRADGTFRLEHVRPDNYLLSVSGKGLTTLDLALAVLEKGLDCGELTVQGTGRIVGVLYDPKGKQRPQPFESGAVVCPYPGAPCGKSTDRSIFFKADEQGRFTVEDVPAGPVSVQFSYMLSSDCVDNYGRTAIVAEGRTTEVRFFDPKKAWDLPLQVVVGDGSESQFGTGTGMAAAQKVENVTTRNPMFLAELEPEPGQTVSFPRPDWYEVEGFRGTPIAVPDVHPGKYRMRLSDFQGSIGMKGMVYETPIEAPAKSPIRIPLAASSITGRAQWTKDYHRLVTVAAVKENGKSSPHYAYCDEKGNFCLRYLSPGQYTICLHDDNAGFSRVEHVALAQAVTIAVKPQTLRPGGTITGTVRWTSSRPIPDRLTLTDAHGIVIEPREEFRGLNGGEYRFGGLWPGRWTLAAWSGKDMLASDQVDLQGTETISRVLTLNGKEKAESVEVFRYHPGIIPDMDQRNHDTDIVLDRLKKSKIAFSASGGLGHGGYTVAVARRDLDKWEAMCKELWDRGILRHFKKYEVDAQGFGFLPIDQPKASTPLDARVPEKAVAGESAVEPNFISALESKNRNRIHVALWTLKQNGIEVPELNFDRPYGEAEQKLQSLVKSLRKLPKDRLAKLDKSFDYHLTIYSPIWPEGDWPALVRLHPSLRGNGHRPCTQIAGFSLGVAHEDTDFPATRLARVGLHEQVVNVEFEHLHATDQAKGMLVAILDPGDGGATLAGYVLRGKSVCAVGTGDQPADVRFAPLGFADAHLNSHCLAGLFLNDKSDNRFDGDYVAPRRQPGLTVALVEEDTYCLLTATSLVSTGLAWRFTSRKER